MQQVRRMHSGRFDLEAEETKKIRIKVVKEH